MVYARCLYQVVIWADARQRSIHPITKGLMTEYLRHSCRLLECGLLRVHIGAGYVSLLVDLNAYISIQTFMEKLKSWTTAWIVGDGAINNYWNEGWRIYPLSPEDSEVNLRTMDSNDSSVDILSSTKPLGVFHHIILITSRHRLLIPVKYRNLMAQTAAEAATDHGGVVIECSAMRNHLHLLCSVPSDVIISQFIDCLKSNLLQRMLANSHLRRAEGWSEHSVAYTVATAKLQQEKVAVIDQDRIHRCCHPNEMSPLYQRLAIPFVAPLH